MDTQKGMDRGILHSAWERHRVLVLGNSIKYDE